MKPFFIIVFLLAGLFSTAQSRQVCITFDDLPLVTYGNSDTTMQKNQAGRLIRALTMNQIPAIGFINEMKLHQAGGVNSFQLGLLKRWIDSGLAVGNHTCSHPDYNAVSFPEFTADILRGEMITKKLLLKNGKTLKYFRHPFLHVGHTKARADSLDSFLKQHGYTTAPVTIDNEDYLFALAYHRAWVKRDTILMKQIGADYVSYIESKVKYYEKQSIALFGYEIRQILLLHASLLNADYLSELLTMLRRNSYSFIDLDTALKDTAYKTEITVYGKWGISWLDKWAMSQGKKGEFFREDPETPAYIRKLAE